MKKDKIFFWLPVGPEEAPYDWVKVNFTGYVFEHDGTDISLEILSVSNKRIQKAEAFIYDGDFFMIELSKVWIGPENDSKVSLLLVDDVSLLNLFIHLSQEYSSHRCSQILMGPIYTRASERL